MSAEDYQKYRSFSSRRSSQSRLPKILSAWYAKQTFPIFTLAYQLITRKEEFLPYLFC